MVNFAADELIPYSKSIIILIRYYIELIVNNGGRPCTKKENMLRK